MVDPKAELMLSRLADPDRVFFRHKATGKIRDAIGESITVYQKMCEKRKGSTITWERLTAEEAEQALVESFKQSAQSVVDQARSEPNAAPLPTGPPVGAPPVGESLDS